MPLPASDELTEELSLSYVEIANKYSKAGGVFAVATAVASQTRYVAFSPAVQADLNKKGHLKHIAALFGKNVRLCTQADDCVIQTGAGVNPGCAEKKLITSFIKANLVMESLCIRSYPDPTELGYAESYLGRGGGDGNLILIPCDSCEQASVALPKPKLAQVNNSHKIPSGAFSTSLADSLKPQPQPGTTPWKGWGAPK